MRIATLTPANLRAFTLVEVLVTLPLAVMTLALVLTIAWAEMDLVGRNFATNVAHLNMLRPVQRLAADIHSSVNDPLLTSAPSNGSFPAVSGTGPAVGLQLDVFQAGPFAVHNNTNANNSNIAIEPNGSTFEIKPGMHFRIPSYNDSTGAPVDRKITKVTKGTVITLDFEGKLDVTITTQGGTGGGSNGTQIVPVYIIVPVNYYVSGRSLIRQEATGVQTVVLRNIQNSAPFNTPFTKPDPTNGRFVGLSLSTFNPDYTNRKYQSSSLMLKDIWIPSKGQLYP